MNPNRYEEGRQLSGPPHSANPSDDGPTFKRTNRIETLLIAERELGFTTIGSFGFNVQGQDGQVLVLEASIRIRP